MLKKDVEYSEMVIGIPPTTKQPASQQKSSLFIDILCFFLSFSIAFGMHHLKCQVEVFFIASRVLLQKNLNGTNTGQPNQAVSITNRTKNNLHLTEIWHDEEWRKIL